jgi:hypothetical protein
MRLRLVSVVLALLGALVLLVVGVLALASQSDWQDSAAWVGYALVLLALAVAGYCLVDKAPVWLGVIVGLCLPLLVASVWQALVPVIEDTGDRGTALVWLLAGVLALVLAAVERQQHVASERKRDKIGR